MYFSEREKYIKRNIEFSTSVIETKKKIIVDKDCDYFGYFVLIYEFIAVLLCRVGYSEFFDFHKSFIFFFSLSILFTSYFASLLAWIQLHFLATKSYFCHRIWLATFRLCVVFSGLKYCIKVFGSSSKGWRKTQK